MKKPLHKHIGQGVKRYHRQFTKYLYERDTIFATLWVFVFIVVLGSIPLNLGTLNPIKLSLKDFELNDLSYSKLKKGEHDSVDTHITIVNIGQADRGMLSLMIDKVAGFQPKVMALDVLFEEAKDSVQDSMLAASFSRNKNLIAAFRTELSGDEGDTVQYAGAFIKGASKYAYVNFYQENNSTIRDYEPFMKDYSGKTYPAFSTAIVEAYNKEAYEKLEKKHHGKTLINYRRRLNGYLVVEPDKLLNDQSDSFAFKNRIVLFGYLTHDEEGNENPNDISDKKFTPMNEKFYGKTLPDMSGIVVHANIISMVLEKNYIKKVPSWANWLLAIVVCWLHMSFFIRYYLENHIWFHLVAKIAQVASVILFVWLGNYLFDSYRIKADMKLSLLVIALAVDVIYFYEAWATWMHKKYNYKTIFKPHHH